MKKERQIFEGKHIVSSLLMLFLLTWLTVCLPYVTESQLTINCQLENTTEDSPENDGTNPLSSTNEEKTESSTSLFSEYLHHPYVIEHSFTELTRFCKCHSASLYLAYHPKLIIPPPEA
jgi:hypothetical protein